jgi:hypothetical protein
MAGTKPGHDEKANHFQVVRESLKMPDTFSVGHWTAALSPRLEG